MTGKRKILAGLLAALCAGTLTAEEIFRIAKPEDFKQATGISQENNILIVNGSKTLFSVQRLELDPAKKYRLSGEFRLRSGSPVKVRLGYAALDAKNGIITPAQVNIVPDTETEITAPVRRGNSVITVKDASRWRTEPAIFYAAFNTRDDFSDLPNRSALKIAPDGIARKGDLWEIKLAQPLKMNMPEGAKVRQHSGGATYIWNTGVATAGEQWMTRTGLLTGIVRTGNPPRKLWPGTKSVRVILSLSGKSDSVIEIRNIRVEELK